MNQVRGHASLENAMQAAPMTETKPYRPNVGVALFNASGHVLIGRRFRDDGPEIVLPGLEWQMPQGGIDAKRKPAPGSDARTLGRDRRPKHAEYLMNPSADLRISALLRPAVASAGEIPRPAPEMVRATLYRPRRRDRSAAIAQWPAGGIRSMAMGAPRSRRLSRGAVPPRSLSCRGAAVRGVRKLNSL